MIILPALTEIFLLTMSSLILVFGTALKTNKIKLVTKASKLTLLVSILLSVYISSEPSVVLFYGAHF